MISIFYICSFFLFQYFEVKKPIDVNLFNDLYVIQYNNTIYITYSHISVKMGHANKNQELKNDSNFKYNIYII
jgi:hypothetical protein